METVKKIYLAIMGMTIISLVVLCLYSIGVLDKTVELTTNGSDPTGLYTFIIAICIAAMGFVFSRSANVIANRKTTAVGYLAVIAGLIILLILAVILIFKLKIEGNLLLLIRILIGITIFLTVMVLVFEIPQANKSHRHFQYFTAILIAVTTVIYLFGNSFLPKSLFTVDTSSKENEKTDEPSDIFDNRDEIEDESNNKKVSTAEKIKSILLYSSIGAFLLNPMLRIYYIDKDYDETKEIDNIIYNSTGKYQIDAQPTKVPYTQTTTYKEPEKPSPPPVPIPTPKPTVSEIQPVEEVKIEEKVINPNFKQDDLPEAIIPTISGQTPSEQPVQDNNGQPVNNNMVQQPTSEVVQQPVEGATPLEQVAQNKPPTVVNATPQQVAVSTPLDQVVQPNQNQ